MTATQMIEKIKLGEYGKIFTELYGERDQKERFVRVLKGFIETYGEKEVALYSAPGRTEICGNHTDHNNGKVIAGSVTLDVIAVAAKTDDNMIRVKSEGHKEGIVELNDLSIRKEEYNNAQSLIRGIASAVKSEGYDIGGFCAYTSSDVLSGSGLSSSAAFEVLLGTVMNGEYCDNKMTAVKIAQIAQYAENEYFGKPCGLMDQMASSVGGIISIDFKDPQNPIINKVEYNFKDSKTALCIVDVGGSHADLTHEYATIPAEMKAVANFFDCNVLREVPQDKFTSNIAKLREQFDDRSVLRAMHYFAENERVDSMINYLKNKNFDGFMKINVESGQSSFQYLQNVFCTSDIQNQPMSIAICIAEKFLKGKGSYRVHGGGFGGTVQCFVPNDMLTEFKSEMEKVFGDGSCHIISIREKGGVKISV